MNLFNAARKICESFTYDPGHSDLDNEQPIAIHCTLGDWRRLNSALRRVGPRTTSVAPTDGKTHATLAVARRTAPSSGRTQADAGNSSRNT